MKELQLITKHLFGKMFLFFLLTVFTMGCEKEELDTANLEVANASVKSMNTVKITSTGMNFIAPDEIPSGWNTFEYTNNSAAPHFFLLVKVPENITLERYSTELTIPFNEWLWELTNNPEAIPDFPDWFSQTLNYGGSGIIDPGQTAVTSINLPPGNYIMECYIKMPGGGFEKPGGVFHSFPVNETTGMVKQLTVTTEKAKEKEPKPDITIDITINNGYVIDNEINRPGLHTFAVNNEGGLTADVHLVRFDEGTEENLAQLNSWMFWMNNLGALNEGMMTPAPAGFTFLGGAQELSAGGTTYFQALLKPGNYAFIAEWPDSMASGYYHEFEVGGKK
ncbi:hypothetical protein [Salinimicrobium sediminilitoris]|uniref:hypothetical protein n=1 Tax=Salinimicrobium sediminilitoris TaxID=2876715 RepID=UPI001E39F905|nr:hypothetical protein [Salinimicrobium sediminilitoris]MCC8360208.1 hypothetical protein [Salinimicrobium sediminilitoris]